MRIVHSIYTLGIGPEPGISSVMPPPTFEELQAALAANENDREYVPSRWEERFDLMQIDAMLHLLDILLMGLPAREQEHLLRKASLLPGPCGQFGPFQGHLGFRSVEGEEFGLSETWVTNDHDERRKMW